MNAIISMGSLAGLGLVWLGYVVAVRMTLRNFGDASPREDGGFNWLQKVLLALGLVTAIISSYVLLARGGAVETIQGGGDEFDYAGAV